MKIKAKTIGIVHLDYRTVLPLQGELKTLSAESERKLIESLKDKGKFVPEFVWKSPGGEYYTMDGHSRLKVYAKHGIEFEGMGYEIPFLEIQADDMEDAKQKLLLINSDYGKISKQGIVEFTKDMRVSSDWLNRHIDMTAFSSFDFVDASREMMRNLKRDLLQLPQRPTGVPLDTPPQNIEQAIENREVELRKMLEEQPPAPPARQPLVTDDDYQAINEVVLYSTKLQFNEIVNRVQADQALSKRHEAIDYIVKKFAHEYA